MIHAQFNHQNFGRQILAARAIALLTRVELAKLASLAHTTVKLAEEGDKSVPEDALVKICRALEGLGFEFLDGTFSTSLAFHDTPEEVAAVTADTSMPGWVRRIYPRRLDARGLVHDLEACGVQIDNANRLVDLCAPKAESWPDAFIDLVKQGRKFGIRFSWRNGDVNPNGVRHVVRIYPSSEEVIKALLQNIEATPLA